MLCHTRSRIALKASISCWIVVRIETAAEVARRGGVGNPPDTQRIQIGFVVAPQFQMLQARATGQQVVGNVQHVVRFLYGR